MIINFKIHPNQISSHYFIRFINKDKSKSLFLLFNLSFQKGSVDLYVLLYA